MFTSGPEQIVMHQKVVKISLIRKRCPDSVHSLQTNNVLGLFIFPFTTLECLFLCVQFVMPHNTVVVTLLQLDHVLWLSCCAQKRKMMIPRAYVTCTPPKRGLYLEFISPNIRYKNVPLNFGNQRTECFPLLSLLICVEHLV